MVDKKENKSIDNIMDDIDMISIQKSIDAGVIYPRLKFVLNRVYSVEVVSKPKSFKSKFGISHSLDVIYDDMNRNIVLAKSLKFQMLVEMKRQELWNLNDDTPDWNKLIGKTLIIQKLIGDTKDFQNVELYSCQIK